MSLAEACGVAYAMIESAAVEASARSSAGGTCHTIVNREGATVEAVAQWGDEREGGGALCKLCLDDGLVLVFVDGVPTRLRCTCETGNAFVELTLPYEALFGNNPAVCVVSSPPSYYHPEDARTDDADDARDNGQETLWEEPAFDPAEMQRWQAEQVAAGEVQVYGGEA